VGGCDEEKEGNNDRLDRGSKELARAKWYPEKDSVLVWWPGQD
jgi:hypothetical protein